MNSDQAGKTAEEILKEYVLQDKEMDKDMYADWVNQESHYLIIQQMEEEAVYWKERCLLAEQVILYEQPKYSKHLDEWQKVKQLTPELFKQQPNT